MDDKGSRGTICKRGYLNFSKIQNLNVMNLVKIQETFKKSRRFYWKKSFVKTDFKLQNFQSVEKLISIRAIEKIYHRQKLRKNQKFVCDFFVDGWASYTAI